MNKTIMTVNGRIPADQLGLVDAHSHVWIEQLPGANLDGLILDDAAAITAELKEYKQAGGGAIVDCQPGGVGRNGRRLRQIAQESGVKIIACSGFHLRRYYPDEAHIWQLSGGDAFAYFMNEVQWGLQETQEDEQPVYPGFFKIAAEETLDASPQHLFQAVSVACRISGLAIEMHTEKGADVQAFLQFFLDQGVSPGRLVFCHMDKRPDFGLHRELAQAGVLLEYDTFVRPKYEPQRNAWPLVQKMVAEGLGDHVALATDMALTNMWSRLGGGPGPAAYWQQIKTQLQTLEIDPLMAGRLMGGNIAGRLAVAPSTITRR